MAKRILVPLDETTEHEGILPLIADIARPAAATVRLLHVAPAPDNVVTEDGQVIAYMDQEAARLRAKWRDYVRTVEPLLGDADLECEVRFGNALAEILAEAEEFGADLIAVTTSSRKTLKDRLLGSVAADLMKRAQAPVLLLRPARNDSP
jgi:nucleotide-binding universal stress UspA family protein